MFLNMGRNFPKPIVIEIFYLSRRKSFSSSARNGTVYFMTDLKSRKIQLRSPRLTKVEEQWYPTHNIDHPNHISHNLYRYH